MIITNLQLKAFIASNSHSTELDAEKLLFLGSDGNLYTLLSDRLVKDEGDLLFASFPVQRDLKIVASYDRLAGGAMGTENFSIVKVREF